MSFFKKVFPIVLALTAFATIQSGCYAPMTDDRHWVDRVHFHVSMIDPLGPVVYHSGVAGLDLTASTRSVTYDASSPWVDQNSDGTYDFYFDLGNAADYWETADFSDPATMTLTEDSEMGGTQSTQNYVITDDYLSANETLSPINNSYLNGFTWNVSVKFYLYNVTSFDKLAVKTYFLTKYAPMIGKSADVRGSSTPVAKTETDKELKRMTELKARAESSSPAISKVKAE